MGLFFTSPKSRARSAQISAENTKRDFDQAAAYMTHIEHALNVLRKELPKNPPKQYTESLRNLQYNLKIAERSSARLLEHMKQLSTHVDVMKTHADTMQQTINQAKQKKRK